jgi:glycerol-3-phosphate dehydrogenase
MLRTTQLNRLRDEPVWDVLVIGGGATGLGVAVDAQTRGYRTVLLEQEDFAKGTSSRSTKLVHGGVRYLEQGDVPLVLEALRERGLLHQNAPHIVHHLSFIVPRYKWWEGPFFGIGLKLYDLLAGKLNLSPSRLIDREETCRLIPNIETKDLLGGVQYYDGQFDDSRLAFTLARTAADHGACVLNHVRVTGLHKSDGLVCGADCADQETGETFSLSAKVVINATGIFADGIRRMDDAAAPAAVQPSQGVHLVMDRSFLEGDSAIMVPHTDDGRVLFVIPWHGRVLVGTTDTPMAHPELEPRPLDEEVAFILRNAARYLARDPSPSDILSVFAGQRPLVRPPGKDGIPTKTISRNHEVLVSDSGLVTIVGGKWTTYRKMAQDTVDHAAQLAGLPDQPCVTESLRLHGFRTGPAPSRAALTVFGSDAHQIEHLELDDPTLADPIHPNLPYPKSLVIWAARNEMARTVEDVLARRTRALLLDARASVEAAPEVAALLAAELNRDQTWQESQVCAYTDLAQGYCLAG